MTKTNSMKFKVYTTDYFEKESSLRDSRIKKQIKEKSSQCKSKSTINHSPLSNTTSNLLSDKHVEKFDHPYTEDKLEIYFERRILAEWCISTASLLGTMLGTSGVLKYGSNLHVGSIPTKVLDAFLLKQPGVHKHESIRHTKGINGVQYPVKYIHYTFNRLTNPKTCMPNLGINYSKRMWSDDKGVLRRSEYYKLEFVIDTQYDRVWCNYGYLLQFKNELGNWVLY
jgi:hypothetical protein